jgi:hypothetical protein
MLRARVEKVLDDCRVDIASGACKDYGEYKNRVGYVQGLLDSLKIADELSGDMDK